MPDQRLLTLAREARNHAEETLVKAETFKDAEAREKMREISAQYLKLAEQIEQAAAD